MVNAKVTERFRGVPDGQTKVQWIDPGSILSGELARVAIQEGWAERIETGKPDRVKAEPEKPVGNAQTSGAASRQGQASPKNRSRRSKKQD